MPIYEFLCRGCNTLLNFFSPKVDTQARPICPHCGAPNLERRPARFATIQRRAEAEDGPLADFDEERIESVMDSMMADLENLSDSEDPRQLATIFRRFGEATGLELGPRMQELMARLEAGEDPDTLEEELGDDFEDDAMLEEFFRRRKAADHGVIKPRVDETLYFL